MEQTPTRSSIRWHPVCLSLLSMWLFAITLGVTEIYFVALCCIAVMFLQKQWSALSNLGRPSFISLLPLSLLCALSPDLTMLSALLLILTCLTLPVHSFLCGAALFRTEVLLPPGHSPLIGLVV